MALFQKLYTLKTEQTVPVTLKEAWDFFSSPKNLQKITPDHLGFKITNDLPEKMYPGMIITYIVKPVAGIPMRWCTEITQVKDHHYFIDEQRFGPYTFWHHQHWFKEDENGHVIMSDIVHYGIPLGPIGQMMNGLMVKSQLKEIFSYRGEVIKELWPGSGEAILELK